MSQGVVRIIGGKWRGRKLQVPDVAGLRPTPDRVRETLFNWLAPNLSGAVCLDAFAGTGVLGFEALSRGAAWVEMIDASSLVVQHLKTQAGLLGAKDATIYQASVPHSLAKPARQFDIVFLDPPYQSDLLLPACQYLETHGFLSDHAIIYLEASQQIQDNDLPQTWRLSKSQRAGQVFYHLANRFIGTSHE